MNDCSKKYTFNVPKGKTIPLKPFEKANVGGECKKECNNCEALKIGACKGCSGLYCPDRECLGDYCSSCAVMCYRAKPRIKDALNYLNGLDVDKSPTKDYMISLPDYIPTISRRITRRVVSTHYIIPFYCLFDFEKEKLIFNDVKSEFNIPKDAKTIISFAMKDDKLNVVFDLMMKGKFIDLLKSISGADYWKTPNFSVYDTSNNMDQLLNFKRQFHVGDLMRESGLMVFQEVLYTDSNFNSATIDNAISIIEAKGIKNISINFQLSDNDDLTKNSVCRLIASQGYDTQFLCYGISESRGAYLKTLHPNVCISSFSEQFKKGK